MPKLLWLGIIILLIGFLSFGPIDTKFKKAASQYTGLTTIKIPIAGTGSMYPTFPKGKGKTPQDQADEIVARVNMYVFPNPRFEIGRGDIVEFRNEKTDEIEAKEFNGEFAGFVKRIIGLSGDKIEIRSGQVFINDKLLTEAYTALARSSFGGDFLSDCKALTIPKDKYFVMGDNRKASNDSRHEVGLIDERDIGFILPLQKQIGIWDKNFRDTKMDENPASKIKIDKQIYVEFLNSIRKEEGLEPLKYVPKLETSANLRGKNIMKFNDFSFEATRSGYTIENSFSDSGYWNPIRGESIITGYYFAHELIEGFSEFKKSKGVITDKDITEIGISEVEGEINGCPTQVIVTHFAGYVPPNYSQELLESFKTGFSNLKTTAPSWISLKEDKNQKFYLQNKAEIDRLIEIINLRILSLGPIVAKMTDQEWLTNSENEYLKEDEKLGSEQNELAKKINELIKSF